MKKALLWTAGGISLALVILVAQAQRHVVSSYSVVIDAPVNTVWDFLSDNRNAKG